MISALSLLALGIALALAICLVAYIRFAMKTFRKMPGEYDEPMPWQDEEYRTTITASFIRKD